MASVVVEEEMLYFVINLFECLIEGSGSSVANRSWETEPDGLDSGLSKNGFSLKILRVLFTIYKIMACMYSI